MGLHAPPQYLQSLWLPPRRSQLYRHAVDSHNLGTKEWIQIGKMWLSMGLNTSFAGLKT